MKIGKQRGYGLIVSLTALLVSFACGGNESGGGGQPATGRVTITLSADPTSIPADGLSTSIITANLVSTRDSNPVADGTTVSFSLETSVGGTVYPASTTTTNGIARTTLTSGTTAGSITLKAQSDTFSKTLGVEFTEPTSADQAYFIVASASPSQIPIYGSSLISAEIKDGQGELAADGTEVTFTSALPGASIDNPVQTVGGVAMATLTAASTPGWSSGVTITVAAGGSTDKSLKIQVLDLVIPSLSLLASVIPVGGSTTVTAEVLDTQGNLAWDETPVIFSSSLLGTSITPLVNTAGGVAVATFTAGNFSGTAAITAKVGNKAINIISLTVGVSNPSITASAKPDRISIGKTSLVEVEVRSNGALAPDGTPVHFSTDLAGATVTPELKTVGGMVQATFTAGTKGGTARVTIKCGNTTVNNLTITVVGDVTSIMVYASPLTIAVYDSSNITADVRDAANNPVVDGTIVNFSTDKSSATFSKQQVETANGLAITTFTAGASYGTAKIIVDSGGIRNESRIITISPPQVGSIEFTSATPKQVGVKGSGLPEVSTVVFTVRDDHGNAAPDGTLVTFNLYGPKGGDYLSPLQTSTTDGKAITHLQSGTVAGPVRIEASTAGGTLSTASIGISIGAGLPSSSNFSLAIAKGGYNVAGDCYGPTVNVSAFLADRYSNFVAQNTSVNFFTEGGGITPTAWSGDKGVAVAYLQIMGPAPVDQGPAAFYDCSYSDCLFPCSPERSDTDTFYGPHHTYNPRDGVSTILVATIGEESFDDKNGNGVYNSGESFMDLSEPYLDADDDGIYDYAEAFTDGVDVYGNTWSSKNQTPDKYDPPTPWVDVNLVDDDTDGVTDDCDNGTTDCNNRWDPGEICLGNLENRTNPSQDCNQNPSGCVCFPGEGFKDKWLPGRTSGDGMWNDAEFYVDYNQNGRFDGPNGLWDAQTMLWKTIDQLFTTGLSNYEVNKLDVTGCGYEYPAAVSTTNGQIDYFVLDVSDENFNPLDNLKITFAGNGCKVYAPEVDPKDPVNQYWTHFFFGVGDPDAVKSEWKPCEVTIEVSWSNDCGSWKSRGMLTGACQ